MFSNDLSACVFDRSIRRKAKLEDRKLGRTAGAQRNEIELAEHVRHPLNLFVLQIPTELFRLLHDFGEPDLATAFDRYEVNLCAQGEGSLVEASDHTVYLINGISNELEFHWVLRFKLPDQFRSGFAELVAVLVDRVTRASNNA